jgi:hypothetical protein
MAKGPILFEIEDEGDEVALDVSGAPPVPEVQEAAPQGQAMQIVLAGPFANPSQTSQALTQVRRAGYSDAFTRK